jgi:hypothetical protein
MPPTCVRTLFNQLNGDKTAKCLRAKMKSVTPVWGQNFGKRADQSDDRDMALLLRLTFETPKPLILGRPGLVWKLTIYETEDASDFGAGERIGIWRTPNYIS